MFFQANRQLEVLTEVPDMQYLRHFLWIIVSLCAACLFVAGDSDAQPGSCADFQFPTTAEGAIDWPHTVKVIEQDALVEETATSNMSSRILDFNTSLRVMKAEGSRVQVRELNAYTPLGWMERSALLCGISPLKGSSGLEQKFYSKYAYNAEQAETRAMKAYPVSDLLDCAGQCHPLSRFTGYFVFAETRSSLLLSDTYYLNDASKLVGWADKQHGVLWDSGYGVRPADGEQVCAYSSPDNALQADKSGCVPVPGGAEWLRSDLRMPVLDRLEQDGRVVYHVLLTLPDKNVEPPLLEAYIPASPNVEEELWLTGNDLDTWISFLREFEALGDVYAIEPEELRETFVFTLTDALENVFRRSLRERTGIPLSEYLQHERGLTARYDSPVFRYSIEDLMDAETVPDCEIPRLVVWLQQTRHLLSIVYHGDQRPVYTREPFPGECPAGQQIPYISGDIRSAPLGDDPAMRYDHSFQKARAYWVPKEYMP